MKTFFGIYIIIFDIKFLYRKLYFLYILRKKRIMIKVDDIVLPDKALTNFELDDAVKKLKIKKFRGVFVRDQLPKKPRSIEFGILNTGDSKSGGYHWICWYKKGKNKYSFDSYGLPPPLELVKYLGAPVSYNTDTVQKGDTSFCGHLCLYVIERMSKGTDFQSVINSLF